MNDAILGSNYIKIENSKATKKTFRQFFKQNKALYLMVLPGLIITIIFKYLPFYGILVSFENFNPAKGVFGSEWVGFSHFLTFFKDPYFFRLFKNTFLLGFYSLIFGFPAPILLALLFNEVKNVTFKKVTQTISYMPYFLSIVIVIGLLKDMISMSDGVVNEIIAALGFEKINFLIDSGYFRPMYVITGIWQGVGYGSIIYLGAISNINPELYESAVLDGASRLKQAIYITIPCIAPTIVVLFIFAVGGILGNDFQKILLMYNPSVYETADVISTYVYRQGILGASYSYASAVGLFNSVVSFIFLITTNRLSRKISETSLW
ncbi:MAG: ABC transporter permease subunit [Clostridiaceae bacterium]